MERRNVYLRRADSHDTPHIHALLCEPEVYRYLTDGVAPSIAASAQWVRNADAVGHSAAGIWVLTNNGEQVLGVVRLESSDAAELELTYLLHPSEWGRGCAARMSHTAMISAYADRGIRTIWAGTDEANMASVGVMRRLGMSFRGHVEYPLGPGVEYEMHSRLFDAGRIEPLEIR